MAPGPRPPAAMDVPEPPCAPPEPPDLPELSELTLSLSQCDRALASSSDLATMDDDDMGIQEQPNLAKDSQEMEQILNDLNNTDLGQADLLQAIKTLETGDVLSTGDADSIFPLSGFDMAEPVDSESDANTMEEKIKATQLQLERRCAFLLRRMRMLQARTLGKRVSEEVAHTFDKAMKGARKDGVGRPMGLKAFLKKVETTAALQASASSRSTSVLGPKYYKAGTSKGDASKSASIAIPSGTLAGLEDTAGALRSHVSAVKHALDSDATASSSGAESNDEAVVYNNPHQQHMPIEKRALWSYQRARASIAARWCWLQAQVQELEYKIRQHTDLHKQVREAKGPVQFEGEPAQPSAYEGLLPGASLADDDPATETCARHRPLRRDTFKKRKLLQMHNLHIATNKAAKPADVHCSCEHGLESCCVCTGRASPTQPASEGLARLDPGYHPVLSDFKGLKRGRPPLSRRIKERKQSEETVTSTHERSRGRGSTEARARAASFDIDNIVIPQSVAAATRPQILTYKEIVTPKWRVMEMSDMRLNNGVSKIRRLSLESEEEDISDAAVLARHSRSEARERGRYLSARRPRRATATAGDAACAPAPALPAAPQPPRDPHESVRPYSPRRFPLPEHTYSDMLASMPRGYRPPSPPSPAAHSPLSPLSPAPYEGDDPDDVEWDPSQEKHDKRKTTFR
ncbi:KAT8 regulatory NSL complex subunit 1 [Leguminivora glycinivorella]|uniref:KAT8 regulatory NSL complex subunit 1 n=1 Tax=Leguminivora glycinivorella TaxID=1035111 RepID=UPI00200EB994|nr:KAT8 regulatory NSL complex subunit 1 [Leguminivora glycinivorella]